MKLLFVYAVFVAFIWVLGDAIEDALYMHTNLNRKQVITICIGVGWVLGILFAFFA